MTDTLKDKEYRYMVNPDGPGSTWVHPAEVQLCSPSWVDCTDMSDAEFYAFILSSITSWASPPNQTS
jgi:hypothetical protein